MSPDHYITNFQIRGGIMKTRKSIFIGVLVALSAISVFALVLAGCGSSGGVILPPPADVLAAGDVSALYNTNGAGWNDYVKNDGTDVYSATGAACDGTETGGYDACIHGGEKRSVRVSGVTDCTGLSASDSLGAFDWTCSVMDGSVYMVSKGLKENKNLSDLLDFSIPGWKANSVTVTKDAESASTSSGAWWSNPVVEDNDGIASGAVAGTIYVITAAPGATYTLDADKVSLVAHPRANVTGSAAVDEDIISATSQSFLWIEGVIDATGDSNGITLFEVSFSVLGNVTASNASGSGVLFDKNCSNNTLVNIAASNNGINGLYLKDSSNNSLSDITVANNGINGVDLSGSSENKLSNLSASNNGFGVSLSASSDNNRLFNITAFNNKLEGVTLSASSNNSLADITAANNAGYGVYLLNSSYNTLHNIASANNGYYGAFLSGSSYNTMQNIASANNAEYGVYLAGGSNKNRFTGEFKVGGNNGAGAGHDCYVEAESTNGHLWDDIKAGIPDDAAHNGLCLASKLSDFGVPTTGITLASSFAGKVVAGDLENNSDSSSGIADYPADPRRFDWSSFENIYRGWGINGSAFPAADHTGQWTSGKGQIWDWSALAKDTVILESLSYPSAGDIANSITHTWYSAVAPTQQSDCDIDAPGSTFVTDHCETTWLRNTVEILGDAIGNDDTLCESHETCLFTPNIGAYQGHGNLVSAGTFTDSTTGGLAGITLLKYETNGY
jgi:parallel beta-helix repeat protein